MADESAEVKVQLEPHSSFKVQLFTLPNSIMPQANFTGTVEYEGYPEYRWPVSTKDPGMYIIREDREVAPDGQVRTKFLAMIPLQYSHLTYPVFYYVYT